MSEQVPEGQEAFGSAETNRGNLTKEQISQREMLIQELVRELDNETADFLTRHPERLFKKLEKAFYPGSSEVSKVAMNEVLQTELKESSTTESTSDRTGIKNAERIDETDTPELPDTVAGSDDPDSSADKVIARATATENESTNNENQDIDSDFTDENIVTNDTESEAVSGEDVSEAKASEIAAKYAAENLNEIEDAEVIDQENSGVEGNKNDDEESNKDDTQNPVNSENNQDQGAGKAEDENVESFGPPTRTEQVINNIVSLTNNTFDKKKKDIREGRLSDSAIEQRRRTSESTTAAYESMSAQEQEEAQKTLNQFDDPRIASLNIAQIIGQERLDRNEWNIMARTNQGLSRPFKDYGITRDEVYESTKKNPDIDPDRLKEIRDALRQEDEDHVDAEAVSELFRDRAETYRNSEDPEERKKYFDVKKYEKKLERNRVLTGERNESIHALRKLQKELDELVIRKENMTLSEQIKAGWRKEMLKGQIKKHEYIIKETDGILEKGAWSKSGLRRKARGLKRFLVTTGITGALVYGYGLLNIGRIMASATIKFINATNPEVNYKIKSPVETIKRDFGFFGNLFTTRSDDKKDKK